MLNNLKAQLSPTPKAPVVAEAEAVTFDIESFDAEAQVASLDLESFQSEIETSEQIHGQITDLVADLESITDYSDSTVVMSNRAIANVKGLVGLDHVTADMEAINQEGGREAARQADLEGLKEMATKVLEAIKSFFEGLVTKAVSLYNKVFKVVASLEKAAAAKAKGKYEGKVSEKEFTIPAATVKLFTVDGESKFDKFEEVSADLPSQNDVINKAIKLDADKIVEVGDELIKMAASKGVEEIKDTAYGKVEDTRYKVQGKLPGDRQIVLTVGWKKDGDDKVLSKLSSSVTTRDPKAKFEDYKAKALEAGDIAGAYGEVESVAKTLAKFAEDVNKHIFEPSKKIGGMIKSAIKEFDKDADDAAKAKFENFKTVMGALQSYASSATSVMNVISNAQISVLKARYKFIEKCEKNLGGKAKEEKKEETKEEK